MFLDKEHVQLFNTGMATRHRTGSLVSCDVSAGFSLRHHIGYNL